MVISGPAPEDGQRHTTGTLHQPNNDRNQEEKQSNRGGCFENQMGQAHTESLPLWNRPIQNRVVPSFNKVKPKVTLRMEKWIMELHEVDYEIVYEQGKDKADTLDILCEHPLPEAGWKKTKENITWNVNADPSAAVTRIRKLTQKDEVMQSLAKKITKETKEYWKKHKGDKDLGPYLHVKLEPPVVGGLFFQRTSNRTTTSTSKKRG